MFINISMNKIDQHWIAFAFMGNTVVENFFIYLGDDYCFHEKFTNN